MTDEQILKKAIEKAVENGYEWFLKDSQEGYKLWTCEDDVRDKTYFNTIFSHNFAKAFWKGWEVYAGPLPWQHHLQMMVLEPEPLKYLEKFLKEAK